MFLMADIPWPIYYVCIYPRSLGTTACILISEDDNFCCKFLPPKLYIQIQNFYNDTFENRLEVQISNFIYIITIAQTILCMI